MTCRMPLSEGGQGTSPKAMTPEDTSNSPLKTPGDVGGVRFKKCTAATGRLQGGSAANRFGGQSRRDHVRESGTRGCCRNTHQAASWAAQASLLAR